MNLRQYVKEAFSQYDSKSQGTITTQYVADALKDLGYVMSGAEVNEVLSRLDRDGSTHYKEFEEYCIENPPPIASDDELLNALETFRDFDYDTLKFYLMRLSNKLNEEEISFIDNHIVKKK